MSEYISILWAILLIGNLLFFPGFFWFFKKTENSQESILAKWLKSLVCSLIINQFLIIFFGYFINSSCVYSFSFLTLFLLWTTAGLYLIGKGLLAFSSFKVKMLPIILIITTLLVSAIPRIDLVVDRNGSDINPIIGSSIHDDIKHIATINSLKSDGIFSNNPFFADEKLKYYIPFYVLPAAISNSFAFESGKVWFFWTTGLNIIFILIVFLTIESIVRKKTIALLLTLSTAFFTGWDILPTIYYGLTGYIEGWNGIYGLNIQFPSSYLYLMYLPQHVFALSIYLLFFLPLLQRDSEKKLKIQMGIISGIMFSFSPYIGLFILINTIFFILLESSFLKTKIKNIFAYATFFAITILPTLPLLLGNSGGLKLSYPHAEIISQGVIWQFFFYLTVVLSIEMGFPYLASWVALFNTKKIERTRFFNWQLSLFFVSLLLMMFISSKAYNDWAMKGSFLVSLGSLFIFCVYIRKYPAKFIYYIPLILIGTGTFFFIITSLSKPYIRMEKSAFTALEFSKNNIPKKTEIIAPPDFYSSLIPLVSEHPTTVGKNHVEANAIANQGEFETKNLKIEQIYLTQNPDLFEESINLIGNQKAFLIKNNQNNILLFENTKTLAKIYNNESYSIFLKK